jgi:hypothetical protein
MFLRNVEGFLVILGLPALFVLGWVASWVFLRRAPLWGFGLASALSAASIVLAWAVSSGGAMSGSGGDRRVIEFYGMFINGITGLLCVGVLAIATAIVELIRMVFHRGSPVTAHPRDTVSSAHQS